ncbi:MAG: T9SS type A sorting domain-containing protein [Candidatus Cloacimonetes bacterium]|nr:T9SS type A sorting domain-containing protein [Candidatus Cloacimonadota bacterium]
MERLSFFFVITLFLSAGLFADGTEPIGSGTEADPYQVETLDNLLWMSTNSSSLDKHYIQTTDIDASDTQNWNDGEGFSPIRDESGTSFTGSYNGQFHFIDGLYINRPSVGGQGLFYFTNNAVIENLGIINVNLSGHSYVGVLVAINGNNSSINNCYSTGSVSGSLSVGGLVGTNQNNSTISNCYSTGIVYGADQYVGGLVGVNLDSSTISNSYSIADVSVVNDYVGGLVGLNQNNSTIGNCYSTGNVCGSNQYVGGLVGDDYESTVSNSFWDIETSNQTTSAGGTGKTTAEMKTVATFTSLTTIGLNVPWDFVGNPFDDIGNEDYWDIGNLINGGYPFLVSLPVVGTYDVMTEILEVPELNSNYPNPFNPETTISFSIPEDSNVDISIYNIKGQKVKTIAHNQYEKGNHSIVWNGIDESGETIVSGVYFYKLYVNGQSISVKKCLMLK